MGKFLVCFYVGDIEGRIEIYARSIQDAQALIEKTFNARVVDVVVCN